MAAGDFLDAPLGDFLDTIAGEGPAPGGGSVAAIVVAMAAGLVGLVADAAAACVRAEGGTRAAAKLVEINLGATDDDPRVRHVRLLVDVAAEAVERAFAAAQ